EFAYWMKRPAPPDCASLPDAATLDDDALYDVLDHVNSPHGYDDASQLRSGMQYVWQDAHELGYPVWEHAHLDALMMYSYEDWGPMLPPGTTKPAYDPSSPRALADWV